MTYVRYSPALEEIKPDEAETFARIAETFTGVGEKVRDNEGRATRFSHAKSTGLLKGELEILPGLPLELAQGLAFARALRGGGAFRSGSRRASRRQGLDAPRVRVEILGVDGAVSSRRWR